MQWYWTTLYIRDYERYAIYTYIKILLMHTPYLSYPLKPPKIPLQKSEQNVYGIKKRAFYCRDSTIAFVRVSSKISKFWFCKIRKQVIWAALNFLKLSPYISLLVDILIRIKTGAYLHLFFVTTINFLHVLTQSCIS